MIDWIEEFKKIKLNQIPKDTVQMTKRCLLDTLGVIYKGSTYPNMKPLQNILNQTSEQGCTAIGYNKKVETSDAALYNGTAAHSVELDDFLREGSVHPGVVVIPVALAIAQETKASGNELLKSIIVGYEVMGRVGMSAKGTLYNRGFHPTAICGVYGAAATASYLYNLTKHETNMALGIAGNQSFGLMAYKSNGAWTKRLNAGWAAKVGVLAAKLARVGFIGPDNVVKGRYGFAQAYCERFDEGLLAIQEGQYLIDKVSFKPHSSCRFTHSPIDAILEIVEKKSLDINEITKIEVYTHKTAIDATMKPTARKYRPFTIVDAQFSIPFCLGLALKYKSVLPDMFSKEMLENKHVLQFADKVEAFEDKKYTKLFPNNNACRLIVKTKDAEYEYEIMNSKGDPENPLKDKEIIKKFNTISNRILSEKEQEMIIEAAYSIETDMTNEKLTTMLEVNRKNSEYVQFNG